MFASKYIVRRTLSIISSNNRKLHFPKCLSSSMNFSTNINYIETGYGQNALLFLPGALGSIYTDFKPQVMAFEKLPFKSVFWDPPGYGKSRPPNREFSNDFFEHDCDAAYGLMKQLGHDKYSILGWSDGAITAMMMALKYPGSVQKLVVWGGNGYVDEKDLKLYEGVRDVSNWSEKMKKPMVDLYGLDYFKRTWENWIDAMASIYHEKQGELFQEDLSNIGCPTLIVHGEKDPMVGNEHPKLLHEKIQNSKLVMWKEAKHNLHLRYAEEFNKLVIDFLND